MPEGSNMILEDRKQDDVLIVKLLEERLDASVAEDFHAKMTQFIQDGNRHIVLDMSEVDFIDSSGLGSVIAMVKKLGDTGELVICEMRAAISSLFHMTHMDKVIKIFQKQEEAIFDLSPRDTGKGKGFRRIKLVIDSRLENVSLIGLIINKLCSSIPLSDTESYQVELCVVEAANNSIEHAYGMEQGHEVEVIFTLHSDRLIVDVCDTGKPMEKEYIEQNDVSLLEIDPNDIDNVAEQGRGIPIMKHIMDTMTYKTERGRNCLTLTKNI